jgi:hypothetical protein
MDSGETITCIGRQCLRMMIMFFMKKGYKPLVMDTDGVNFEAPESAKETIYVGKGLNELVKEGKEYVGIEADTAEFNDIFMRNEMGLDIDYVAPACINVSRKNYIIKMMKKGKEKIKLTGNTIKSKKLPLYIEDFLDKGVKMLLEGKGQEFVDWYYEYLTKIYNKQIPLMKIAQRAKVKLSMDDYIKRSKQKTKSGGAMSMMAHMELALKSKLNVNLGDVIFYVNNGTKASQGDVQKVTPIKLTKKQREEYFKLHGKDAPPDKTEVQINCYMLEQKTLENNPEMTGEYNVSRAIVTFNKRIEPLLVVFKDEIRDNLLVLNPEDRGLFTKEQCELTNGIPFEEKDQDSVEDLLTITEQELKYWDKRGIDPFYIYELAENGWEKFVDLQIKK